MNKTVSSAGRYFYLDSGNAGDGTALRVHWGLFTLAARADNDDEAQTIRVRDHFSNEGYVLNSTLFYYLDNGGQHSEAYWGARFWVPMTDLFPPEVQVQ